MGDSLFTSGEDWQSNGSGIKLGHVAHLSGI